MPRSPLNKNKSLPPNLYWDSAHNLFRYRRPNDGRRFYIGKNKTKAVAAAKTLNSMLMKKTNAEVTNESKRRRHKEDEVNRIFSYFKKSKTEKTLACVKIP